DTIDKGLHMDPIVGTGATGKIEFQPPFEHFGGEIAHVPFAVHPIEIRLYIAQRELAEASTSSRDVSLDRLIESFARGLRRPRHPDEAHCLQIKRADLGVEAHDRVREV